MFYYGIDFCQSILWLVSERMCKWVGIKLQVFITSNVGVLFFATPYWGVPRRRKQLSTTYSALLNSYLFTEKFLFSIKYLYCIWGLCNLFTNDLDRYDIDTVAFPSDCSDITFVREKSNWFIYICHSCRKPLKCLTSALLKDLLSYIILCDKSFPFWKLAINGQYFWQSLFKQLSAQLEKEDQDKPDYNRCLFIYSNI